MHYVLKGALSILAFPVFAAPSSCGDPQAQGSAPAVAALAVAAVAFSPARTGGLVARSVRVTIELTRAASPDAARAGRVVIIPGGADPAEVAAFGHARRPAGLRDREVPLTSWGQPKEAPTRVLAQPSVALPPGRATLVVLLDKRPPHAVDFTVEDAPPPPTRAWPIAPASPSGAWTFCGASSPTPGDGVPATVTLAPSQTTARVRVRDDAPCVDLLPDAPLGAGAHVAPPALGAWPIDPAPVDIDTTLAGGVVTTSPCADGATPLGPVCLRVDDDRVVLLGDAFPRLVLGRVGAQAVLAPLDAGARFVVRGLPSATTLDAAVAVRDPRGEESARITLHTLQPRRHVVINEVLARPPSGVPTQRFVEIANDGSRSVALAGLRLGDGDAIVALPAATLAAGEFAVIVTRKFVDGLAGDDAPPPKTQRLIVSALRLTGETSILERNDTVISRLPKTSPSRVGSRGRRTPSTPDDAPAAFAWDALGRATPGLPNRR